MLYVRTRIVVYIIHSKFYCCKLLMYPVLKITHMLNFLDTFSVGVIGLNWVFKKKLGTEMSLYFFYLNL
jgi:hypothetical protein